MPGGPPVADISRASGRYGGTGNGGSAGPGESAFFCRPQRPRRNQPLTKDTKRKIDGNGDALAGNGNGAINGVDFAPWIKASEAMFNGMMTLGQEVSDFATSRLRENMEFTSTVLKCGDPQEA